jgi:hypothetical protein
MDQCTVGVVHKHSLRTRKSEAGMRNKKEFTGFPTGQRSVSRWPCRDQERHWQVQMVFLNTEEGE